MIQDWHGKNTEVSTLEEKSLKDKLEQKESNDLPDKQFPKNATLKQRVAQFLQKNNLFMNLSFVDKFVHKQLDILPESTETNATSSNRKNFINQLTNQGAYKNLPSSQRMSDPEKMAQIRRKMEQEGQKNDGEESR